MNRRVRIEVTAEDIANGTPDDPGCCPIAIACLRQGFRRPLIDSKDLEFGPFVVPTPPEAKAFIERFDARCPVEPFAFEVDIIDDALEAEAAS